jgi:hypothetical protein
MIHQRGHADPGSAAVSISARYAATSRLAIYTQEPSTDRLSALQRRVEIP